MVKLKEELAAIHHQKTGGALVYLSAARFDQQASTKPHIDGGPESCMLMLGYEPSEVDSELEFADYSKCAFDLGITPREFLEQHNPMFQAGYELLRPYSTRIPCFSASDYQIICVNNSVGAYSESKPNWQGVLHTAEILTPDDTKRRIINSTMIASAPAGTADAISHREQQEFITTNVVRRKGYDRLHLEDDS